MIPETSREVSADKERSTGEDRRAERHEHWGVKLFRYVTGGGVILLLAGNTIFWLFSDQHNDSRYSKIADVPAVVQAVGDIRYVQISNDNERRDNLKLQLAALSANLDKNTAEAKAQLTGVESDIREVRNLLWTLANKQVRPERTDQ